MSKNRYATGCPANTGFQVFGEILDEYIWKNTPDENGIMFGGNCYDGLYYKIKNEFYYDHAEANEYLYNEPTIDVQENWIIDIKNNFDNLKDLKKLKNETNR